MSREGIVWQVYGALVFVATVLAALFEFLYFTFLFFDRSILTDRFLVPSEWFAVAHIFALTTLAALIHYGLSKSRRARSLAGVPFAEEHALKWRIGPFPVRADLVFFLMVAVLASFRGGVVRGAAFVVSATLAILVHELAHAWAARAVGRIASIHLHALGGTTRHFGPLPTRREILIITAAGPAMGIVIGVVILAATHPLTLNSLARGIVADLVRVNLHWGLLNLAPVLPLDGGRLLETVLKRPEVATYLSIFLGIAATFGFGMFGMPLTASVFAWLALINALGVLWRQSRPA